MRFFKIVVCVMGLGACDFPRPAPIGDDAGRTSDAGAQTDGEAPIDSVSGHVCAPSQALRCDGNTLVRCNADGTAEASESCALGCNATEVRCNDVAPSNGLAGALDMTSGEIDFDLRATATINTDDGTVQVGGNPIAMRTTTITQTSAPTIRVLVVRSLITSDVTVIGSNALAIVSNGDIKINGTFAASAHADAAGAGRFNDSSCQGKGGDLGANGAVSGSAGGGFGGNGGNGGTATSNKGNIVPGGARGLPAGNAELLPLRGGCDAGPFFGPGPRTGGGGGAIQLVSRTKISIAGVVAANGGSNAGGGSGGGILLEAPVIESTGNMVANGGAGAGANGTDACFNVGEDGRLDAMPAIGGLGCSSFSSRGGNGAARNTGASNGDDINGVSLNSPVALAGHGGGGVGRIRINTASGGLNATGVFSPNPTIGTIATR